MTTRAGRFGPRIGGYRVRARVEPVTRQMNTCEMAANLYRAAIHAEHGHASDLIYVVAFDEEQAEKFVRLRREDYAQVKDIDVSFIAATVDQPDLSSAVLGFETTNETVARQDWWDNRQEAAAEREFNRDMADGGSAPSGIQQITHDAYRQRREAR